MIIQMKVKNGRRQINNRARMRYNYKTPIFVI